MTLSGKQKRALRALGQTMKPTLQLGRAGLGEPWMAFLAEAFRSAELVKVRLPGETGPDERKQLAAQLAEASRSELAGQVGWTILLYRPNPDLPPDRRVALPEAD